LSDNSLPLVTHPCKSKFLYQQFPCYSLPKQSTLQLEMESTILLDCDGKTNLPTD
jgi:hypothetical protein